MQGPKRDPYLWVHLAGLAALPLCAELCLLGLAAGDPLLPGGWDWLLVGLLGTAPIVAMQWLRPFYPFSVLLVSLRADRLNETQQRILQRWAGWETKAIALVASLLVLWALQRLDQLSPLAAEIAPLDQRAIGLLVVWLGALLGSLLLTVALVSLWVLLTPQTAFSAIEPFPVGNVPSSFLRLSVRLTKVLPDLENAPVVAPAKVPEPESATPPAPPAATNAPQEEAAAIAPENSPIPGDLEPLDATEPVNTAEPLDTPEWVTDSAAVEESESPEAIESTESEPIASDPTEPEAIESTESEAIESTEPDSTEPAPTEATSSNPETANQAADDDDWGDMVSDSDSHSDSGNDGDGH
ncbi:low-complexity tail membrane protein [Limnothrix redekei]|uniref:Low-complexity tail membrane protein n=1 Tax=Limnothrix redekei LRLZ20PSL1 TaxID=3112953 RepID=A0ABW7CDY8_9CYAN